MQALPIEPAGPGSRPDLDKGFNPISLILFVGLPTSRFLYVVYSVYSDVNVSGTSVTPILPFLVLFVALLIAPGFEFVNGFHDIANEVATEIYAHSLPAELAVVRSGTFNLRPPVPSPSASSPAGLQQRRFAMLFALLNTAIIWNLGTWWLGLPASSSPTLIASIIGVGIANALARGMDGTSGVDWSKATEITYSLLLSPRCAASSRRAWCSCR